jgi:translocation and assembly module TamB
VKWRYRIAIGLGVLVVVIVAGLAVLFQTQAGLNWAVGIAQSHSNGALAIGNVRGKLAGPIQVKNLRLKLDSATITIAHARVDWRPTALAEGKLHITHLQAGDIHIKVTSKKSQSKSTGLPDKLDLSLRIIVDDAELHDLDLSRQGNTLRVARLALSLDAGNDEVKVEKLEARGPRGALAGNIQLEPHGAWSVQGDLAEIIRLPDYPTVEGRSHLRGDLKGSLALKQTLHAPFSATLDTTVKNLFDTPHVRGTLETGAIDPRRIKRKWPELKARLHLAFSGNEKAFGANGTMRVSGRHPGRVNLHLKAGLANKTLTISRLNVGLRGAKTAAASAASVAPPGRVSLRGTLGLDAPHNAHLELAWQRFRWPLSGAHPTLRRAAGYAHLNGNLDDWHMETFALLQPGDLPPSRWAIEATGTRHAIHIDHLIGRGLKGRFVGHGKVALDGKRPFQFTLLTHNLHTQPVLKSIKGRLGFDLAARGQLKPLNAALELKKFTGHIDRHDVSGHGRLTWTPDKIALHKLDLAVGPNHLDAHGDWGKRLDLTWRLDAPKLAALGESYGGYLDAHGSIAGEPDTPHIQARLKGGKLRFNDIAVGEIHSSIDLKLGEKPVASLDLALKHATRGEFEIGKLTASLSGPADAQHFDIALRSNYGKAQLSGRGALGKNGWQGRLRRGSIAPTRAPTFSLKSPAKLVLRRNRLVLGHGCWVDHDKDQNQASLCLAANSDKRGWQADMSLSALPLSLGNAWLEGTRLHGQLDGQLKAQGGNGKLDVLAMLHSSRGSVSRDLGDKTARFAFDEAGVEMHVDKTTAQARLGVFPSDGGVLDLRAHVPWREHEKPAGKLRLIAHLPDLSGIQALSDELGKTSGRLDADFTVSGSIEEPDFGGQIRLSHAAFTIPRFGTRIKNIALVLKGTGSGLALSGNLEDGDQGRLALRGQLDRSGNAWAFDMGIEGKDFQVADRPEWRVVISPDLDITLKQHTLAVNGKVNIPKAEITPPHFSNAVRPSDDIVIVGPEQKKKKPPLAFSANLHLSLGDKVHFKGFGLSARIGGELELVSKPGKLTTASGQLKILDGEYKAYGQKLDIRQGLLLYSGGPIANPGLNIRAARRVANVTAGLQVTGTLQDPRMRVFSDPPMSQSNALSYLLFGHGVQQNSGEENSTQEQAANALGIAGATYLAQSVGKRLGLDTVSVENASRYSTNSNQASLFIGKYLSPRLYVSYGIGLYAPINLLRVRYTLSRHWALEAESGTISGADILYNIAF